MNEKEIIEFAKLVGKLKKTTRTGWKIRGVKNPESVAEHSYRTALLVMLIADKERLNAEKLIRMALVHDLEEAIVGDIPTLKKVRYDKEKMFKDHIKTMKDALSILPKNLQKKYLDLWIESEECKTKYAKLLKQIDYIEMMVQCLEYEKAQPKVNLGEFWINVSGYKHFKWDPEFQKIFDKLKKMRK